MDVCECSRNLCVAPATILFSLAHIYSIFKEVTVCTFVKGEEHIITKINLLMAKYHTLSLSVIRPYVLRFAVWTSPTFYNTNILLT